MLISVEDRVALEQRLGLLDNRRVLVAAPSSDLADALCQAFQRRGSRLVSFHTDAPEAGNAQVAPPPYAQTATAQAIRNATIPRLRSAFSEHAGFDIVVNVINLQSPASAELDAHDDIEQQISTQFQAAAIITKITADRMALTMTNGVIVSILDYGLNAGRIEQACAMLARSLLQAMTRSQAAAWASDGLRINAIAPHMDQADRFDGSARQSTELADLALFMASSRAPNLTGLTFAPDEIIAGTP